jgi:hypothetical protein
LLGNLRFRPVESVRGRGRPQIAASSALLVAGNVQKEQSHLSNAIGHATSVRSHSTMCDSATRLIYMPRMHRLPLWPANALNLATCVHVNCGAEANHTRTHHQHHQSQNDCLLTLASACSFRHLLRDKCTVAALSWELHWICNKVPT